MCFSFSILNCWLKWSDQEAHSLASSDLAESMLLKPSSSEELKVVGEGEESEKQDVVCGRLNTVSPRSSHWGGETLEEIIFSTHFYFSTFKLCEHGRISVPSKRLALLQSEASSLKALVLPYKQLQTNLWLNGKVQIRLVVPCTQWMFCSHVCWEIWIRSRDCLLKWSLSCTAPQTCPSVANPFHILEPPILMAHLQTAWDRVRMQAWPLMSEDIQLPSPAPFRQVPP